MDKDCKTLQFHHGFKKYECELQSNAESKVWITAIQEAVVNLQKLAYDRKSTIGMYFLFTFAVCSRSFFSFFFVLCVLQ